MRLLNHKVLGEGQPLVILHGLFGSLDNWITLGKKWSESYQVILVDQRNHGHSFHDEEFSYWAMSEDLKELLDELNVSQINLIGHSMGGKTAMTFAERYPQYLDKLIVADIGPKAYPVHHSTIINAFYEVPVEELKSRNEADEVLKHLIPEFGTRQFLLKNLARTSEGFKWKMNLDVIARNIEEVGKLTSPSSPYDGNTLFINGGNSDYILPEDLVEIKKGFVNASFHTLENAGHWLHAEKPAEFFEAVNQFLKS